MQVIKLCRNWGIRDAEALLLERMGNYESAFDIFMDELSAAAVDLRQFWSATTTAAEDLKQSVTAAISIIFSELASSFVRFPPSLSSSSTPSTALGLSRLNSSSSSALASRLESMSPTSRRMLSSLTSFFFSSSSHSSPFSTPAAPLPSSLYSTASSDYYGTGTDLFASDLDPMNALESKLPPLPLIWLAALKPNVALLHVGENYEEQVEQLPYAKLFTSQQRPHSTLNPAASQRLGVHALANLKRHAVEASDDLNQLDVAGVIGLSSSAISHNKPKVSALGNDHRQEITLHRVTSQWYDTTHMRRLLLALGLGDLESDLNDDLSRAIAIWRFLRIPPPPVLNLWRAAASATAFCHRVIFSSNSSPEVIVKFWIRLISVFVDHIAGSLSHPSANDIEGPSRVSMSQFFVVLLCVLADDLLQDLNLAEQRSEARRRIRSGSKNDVDKNVATPGARTDQPFMSSQILPPFNAAVSSYSMSNLFVEKLTEKYGKVSGAYGAMKPLLKIVMGSRKYEADMMEVANRISRRDVFSSILQKTRVAGHAYANEFILPIDESLVKSENRTGESTPPIVAPGSNKYDSQDHHVQHRKLIRQIYGPISSADAEEAKEKFGDKWTNALCAQREKKAACLSSQKKKGGGGNNRSGTYAHMTNNNSNVSSNKRKMITSISSNGMINQQSTSTSIANSNYYMNEFKTLATSLKLLKISSSN